MITFSLKYKIQCSHCYRLRNINKQSKFYIFTCLFVEDLISLLLLSNICREQCSVLNQRTMCTAVIVLCHRMCRPRFWLILTGNPNGPDRLFACTDIMTLLFSFVSHEPKFRNPSHWRKMSKISSWRMTINSGFLSRINLEVQWHFW